MTESLLESIAQYIVGTQTFSPEAFQTARYCLADALGCAFLSLRYPACTRLLGPVVPGVTVPDGCRIPGTQYELDPVSGAFTLGCMIRWLDFNDTWLGAEWGHPSDCIGGLLPLCDYISRKNKREGKSPLVVKDLLMAMIKSYEIQGGLSLLNSFNKVGFDHVILVKASTAAVATHLLGGTYAQVFDALSQAFADAGPLRTYRHAPNVTSRKSWAAGDASSRGVWLALLTMRGEQGLQSPLSAPKWGLYDVLFGGRPFTFQRPLGSYIIENILFKIAFPAEFHAQTAVEAAILLHSKVIHRLDNISNIQILTQQAALTIIDKQGPLNNPSDRDHCLQYMVAVGLLKGSLTADDYEDTADRNPALDRLREKMHVVENPDFTKDYHDPEKRSIANTVAVHFTDGSEEKITVEYPLGHYFRRNAGIPLLFEKLEKNLTPTFSQEKIEEIMSLFKKEEQLKALSIPEFTSLFLP